MMDNTLQQYPPIASSGDFAIFSSGDERYRYVLGRRLREGKKTVNFIMLNPSTATDTMNDPTVRRCIGFADKWSYDRLLVTNLFALRSTDPQRLRTSGDPIGPENDTYIRRCLDYSELVVCAWGKHGEFLTRGKDVIKIIESAGKVPWCLKITEGGAPSHPLYLKGSLLPRPLT